MGIVEEVGSAVTKVKKGNRVVIPFNIGCGECHFCTHHMESQCDNSNPNPMFDQGGLFGFGKMEGNYPGGQAEYLRRTSFATCKKNERRRDREFFRCF